MKLRRMKTGKAAKKNVGKRRNGKFNWESSVGFRKRAVNSSLTQCYPD